MVAGNMVRLLGLVLVHGLAVWLVVGGCVVTGGLLHLAVVALLLWGTLNPRSGMFGPIQRRLDEDGILLTFDDGPDERNTPVLLDLLKECGVKATFFVVGEKVRRFPDLVRRMRDEGHQIGNHTWSHPQASFWCAGPWRTQREIMRCQEAVRDVTGEAPKLFRAPVGHSNFFVHAVLRVCGLRLIGWSSRGFDGVSRDADDVLEKMKASMKPGGIVLAHEDSPVALEVARGVLDYVEEKGWGFVLDVSGGGSRNQ